MKIGLTIWIQKVSVDMLKEKLANAYDVSLISYLQIPSP